MIWCSVRLKIFVVFFSQYNSLEEQKDQTSDTTPDREKLEEVVRKLERQLTDLKRVEMEKQQLESQLKALEKVLMETVRGFTPLAETSSILSGEIFIVNKNAFRNRNNEKMNSAKKTQHFVRKSTDFHRTGKHRKRLQQTTTN